MSRCLGHFEIGHYFLCKLVLTINNNWVNFVWVKKLWEIIFYAVTLFILWGLQEQCTIMKKITRNSILCSDSINLLIYYFLRFSWTMNNIFSYKKEGYWSHMELIHFWNGSLASSVWFLHWHLHRLAQSKTCQISLFFCFNKKKYWNIW